MKKRAELPLLTPIFATYHCQGSGAAAISKNPSIRNWYLNQAVSLFCNRKFLSGFTSPEIGVVESAMAENPYFEKLTYAMQFLEGHVHTVIRHLIDAGYYVHFNHIDDYYIEGKTFYHTRHFDHDGMICGYDQEEKTYCMYAYDSSWVYRKFWAPQSGFEAGRKAAFRKGAYGSLYAFRPGPNRAFFLAQRVLQKITEYLDSDFKKYPEDGQGKVYGIVVHDYIAKYVDMLFDGTIPYARMDWRVFRLLWEQKKVMLERIERVEAEYQMGATISKRYKALVSDAETIRMLYASHHMRRRDAVLPIIRTKLLVLKEKERELLYEMLERTGGADNEDVMELHKRKYTPPSQPLGL